MYQDPALCIPPLSEVCAVIGVKDVINTHEHTVDAQLLSVITSTKVITSFTSNSDLSISSSVSWAMFKHLRKFCFPNGCNLTSNPSNHFIEYGVFTDDHGARIYMSSLNVPVAHTSAHSTTNNASDLFSVTKLCFFSSHRYLVLMKGVLQVLAFHINDKTMIVNEVQDLLDVLSNVFIPPTGTLDIEFEYKGTPFIVQCQTMPGLVDVPWTLPFMFLHYNAIVEIIIAIISEQQVVFMGKDPTTRVLVMECFLAYIFPCNWIAPYLPVLTEELYGMLDAIGYFILGADRSVEEEIVCRENNIILVDIDDGVITYGEGSDKYPVELGILTRFKEALPRTCFEYFGDNVNKIFAHKKEFDKSHEEFDFMLNARIFVSMQRLLLDLYKGLLFFERSTKKHASIKKKEGYTTTKFTKLQQHLKKSAMLSNLKFQCSNAYLEKQFFNTVESLKAKKTEEMLEEIKALRRATTTIAMSTSHVANLNTVEHALATLKDASTKSPLLFIRGLLMLKEGKPIQAFQSFNKIFELGIQGFPTLEIANILAKIKKKPDIYNNLLKEPFMKQAAWAPLLSDPSSVSFDMVISKTSIYNDVDFPDVIMKIGITRKHDIADKLFKTFRTDSGFVDGQDLYNFCEIWKGIKTNLDHRPLPMVTSRKEKVVKVSNRADRTVKSIVLVCSTYRVYFVDHATGQVCDFINIDELSEIKACFSSLTFMLKSRKPKDAENIKDTGAWWMILEELIGASNRLHKTKDYDILNDARSEILIFEALNKYDAVHGELISHTDVTETDSMESTFFIQNYTAGYTPFLEFRKALHGGDAIDQNTSPSTCLVTENVLCKFSPNSRLNETIIVVISTTANIFIGTKQCNLYRAAATFPYDLEDHMSLILTPDDKWTLYAVLEIEGSLWATVMYQKTRSLQIIACSSFDDYQTLHMHHKDHVVGMVREKGFCYISSIDGAVSVWSIRGKSCTRMVNNDSGLVALSLCMADGKLLQSAKNGFLQMTSTGFTLHEVGFTITKFISCRKLIFGIDKSSQHVIRCFAADTLQHIAELDIDNKLHSTDNSDFYHLIPHKDTHLVVSTRACSLLVYNLETRQFDRVIKNAHSDLITTMFVAGGGEILTGSRSLDGTVTVWVDMID